MDNIVITPNEAGEIKGTLDAVSRFNAQVIIDVMGGRQRANWVNQQCHEAPLYE